MIEGKSDLISLDEATKQSGVSYGTIRRRILDGELVTYRDGRDRRKRLVSVQDLQKLFVPQVVSCNREEAA